MQSVLCYDITDDRRRARLANTLKDFGQRIQESVFYFTNLSQEQQAEMLRRAEKYLGAEDRLHIFPLCDACAAKTISRGQAYVPADEDFYVV